MGFAPETDYKSYANPAEEGEQTLATPQKEEETNNEEKTEK